METLICSKVILCSEAYKKNKKNIFKKSFPCAAVDIAASWRVGVNQAAIKMQRALYISHYVSCIHCFQMFLQF